MLSGSDDLLTLLQGMPRPSKQLSCTKSAYSSVIDKSPFWISRRAQMKLPQFIIKRTQPLEAIKSGEHQLVIIRHAYRTWSL